MIKSERVYVVKRTKIRPKGKATIYVTSQAHTLLPGIVGQLNLYDKFGTMGLSGENDIMSLPIDSILRYTVYIKSNIPVYSKCNTCIGNFWTIGKNITNDTANVQLKEYNAKINKNVKETF